MIKRTLILLAGTLFLAACSGPAETPDESGQETAVTTPPPQPSGDTPQTASQPGKDDGADTAAGGFPVNASVDERVTYYVTTLGPQLPMPINNSTVMDRVSRNGLEIRLHYTLVDPSVTADALQRWAEVNAPPSTCDNALTAQMVRDGASFRYTYSGGNLSREVSVLIDRC